MTHNDISNNNVLILCYNQNKNNLTQAVVCDLCLKFISCCINCTGFVNPVRRGELYNVLIELVMSMRPVMQLKCVIKSE